MSKQNKATAQAEQTDTQTQSGATAPVATTADTAGEKKKRERIPYTHPVRPAWMPENGTVVTDIETTASKTPGQSDGAKFFYKGELLTAIGLKAFVENNTAYALELVNSNLVYRKLNQIARVEGIGTWEEFRPDWTYNPDDGKSQKAAKERAEKAAQLKADRLAFASLYEDMDMTEEQIEAKWQKWLAKRAEKPAPAQTEPAPTE